MEFHVNELSLSGQFATPLDFKEALEPLLRLRHTEPLLQNFLYCSRRFHECRVMRDADFSQTVRAMGDGSFLSVVLRWLNKAGPFWDDERYPNEDDLFYYESHEVTEQGLGEAARRSIAGTHAGTFSFQGSAPPFGCSPLSVIHGFPEDPITTVELDNCWDAEQVKKKIEVSVRCATWPDVLGEIIRRYDGLTFADDAMEPMLPTPFSAGVRERIFERLEVLNRLVAESDDDGKFSPTGLELLNDHFVGGKGWFSDESPSNKDAFKKDLTFKLPDGEGEKALCSWHGKIKTPQTRIHFQWPRPKGQRKIQVVYIGPKITKG